MKEANLNIAERTQFGSSHMNRMRKAGSIPAVVYAAGDATVHAMLNERDFVSLAQKSSRAQLFTFKSDSKSLNGKLAIVKEIQKHPLKGTALHVDFQTLREDQPITVNIAVHVKGDAPGVKLEGGVLSQASHEVKVSCLPRKIPDSIEVDISGLHLNNSIHLKDLVLPEGVKIAGDPEETLLSVVLSKTYEAPVVAAATDAAATAEGAAAAPAAEGATAEAGKEGAKEGGKEAAKEAAPAKKGKE